MLRIPLGRLTLLVHASTVALAALCIVLGYGERLLLALLALMIHEGFHLLAMLATGARFEQVLLTPFGGIVDSRQFRERTMSEQLWIASAGVLGSLLCYALLKKIASPSEALLYFRTVCLCLALLNLLPVLPLDGGRIIDALISMLPCRELLRKGMTWGAILLGLSMVALAAYGAWLGYVNLSLLCTGAYLAYAAWEYGVSRRLRALLTALRLQDRLRRGKATRVQWYACRDDASNAELLRVLRRLPENRLCYVCMINPDGGGVTRTLAPRDVIARLTQEE